jgi:enamine deaminase RidA (YjgF/YER057c/UK114 family)
MIRWVTLVFVACLFPALCGGAVEHVDVTEQGITLRASMVPAGASLAHTAQLFPSDAKDAAGQTEQLLKDLDALLRKVGGSLDTLARINLYAANPQAAADARKVLNEKTKCAVSTVVSALPKAGALVALDGVAVVTADTSSDPANVRILKSDQAVYISGMAAPGPMGEATRLTLEKLDAMLGQLGLGRGDIIHVKSFLQGANDVSASQAEFVKFFGDKMPPVTWVEWTMKDPIEIELTAQMKKAEETPAATTVSYSNPPPSKPSPLYCRVARVHGGRMIYTSGVISDKPAPGDAEAETRAIFDAFRKLIDTSGGDFEHLVKATYYHANAPTGAALNKVRPDFYNPKRPPAASKASVAHIGVEGRNLTIDLIATTPK